MIIIIGDNREPSFRFQRISITVQRFNSILLQNSFSSDEEWSLQIFVLLYFAFNPRNLYTRGDRNKNNIVVIIIFFFNTLGV